MIIDPNSGCSKGFSFLSFSNHEVTLHVLVRHLFLDDQQLRLGLALGKWSRIPVQAPYQLNFLLLGLGVLMPKLQQQVSGHLQEWLSLQKVAQGFHQTLQLLGHVVCVVLAVGILQWPIPVM